MFSSLWEAKGPHQHEGDPLVERRDSMWKIVGMVVLSVAAAAAPVLVRKLKDKERRRYKERRRDETRKATALHELEPDELLGMYAHKVYDEQEAAKRNAAVGKIYEAAHAATHKK
jgi:hypothetical protein